MDGIRRAMDAGPWYSQSWSTLAKPARACHGYALFRVPTTPTSASEGCDGPTESRVISEEVPGGECEAGGRKRRKDSSRAAGRPVGHAYKHMVSGRDAMTLVDETPKLMKGAYNQGAYKAA